MTLAQFITELSRTLAIESLSAYQQEGCSLLLDDTLRVDIRAARGDLVCLSPTAVFAETGQQRERQIKQAMAWSLAWEGGHTCLAQVAGDIGVQTRLSLENDYATLLAALNAHCQFAEQLIQLEFKAVQQVYQDVFIRP